MRSLCLIAAMCAFSAANASFDLMLLPSSDGKIYRYDPANQVHLGSFGSGGTIDATAVNPINGELVLIRQGAASMGYNPNTGALNWASGGGGGVQWIGYNTALNRYDVLASNRFLDTVAGNEYIFGPSLAPTNTVQNYIRYDNGSGLAFGMDYNAGIITFRRWTNGATLLNSNTQSIGTFNYISNLMQHDLETYVVMSNGSSHMFSQVLSPTTTSAGVFGANFVNATLSGFDIGGRVYLVRSHTGFYAVGKDNSSANWRVNELINLNANNWYNAGGVVTSVAYQAALPSIVLAPEPGSMIALGAGLLAILKRRKRAA